MGILHLCPFFSFSPFFTASFFVPVPWGRSEIGVDGKRIKEKKSKEKIIPLSKTSKEVRARAKKHYFS